MSYYQILPDHVAHPQLWHLSEPLDEHGALLDPCDFIEGVPYRGTRPVCVRMTHPGEPLAFNLAAFEMPVVTSDIADLLSELAPQDLEIFPVRVANTNQRFAILNVIALADCLDEQRSIFTRWTADSSRPDLLGQIKMISRIRLDPSRVGDHQLFRLDGWPLALLVSESARRVIESVPNAGVIFDPVVDV